MEKAKKLNIQFNSIDNSDQKAKTGQRSLICNVCTKEFAHNCDLIQHVRTHTGEKPFYCEICRFKCSHHSNLKAHMLSHTGKKSFH